MPDKRSYSLLLAQNNEGAAKVANEVALKRFRKDPAVQQLFAPLLDEVKGMGAMVAAELAWKLFVLIEAVDRSDDKD